MVGWRGWVGGWGCGGEEAEAVHARRRAARRRLGQATRREGRRAGRARAQARGRAARRADPERRGGAAAAAEAAGVGEGGARRARGRRRPEGARSGACGECVRPARWHRRVAAAALPAGAAATGETHDLEALEAAFRAGVADLMGSWTALQMALTDEWGGGLGGQGV